MRPLLAFGLIEVLIILAIIALVLVIFGPAIAKAIGKAKKAGGGRTTARNWVNPAATIPVDTPTAFPLTVLFERRDAAGSLLGTDLPPENTPVFFDLKMIKGTGQIVSATVAGSALPQPKDATVASPAVNVAGTTDTNGAITVTIKLGEASQAELSVHESPDPALPGWTGPATVVSTP